MSIAPTPKPNVAPAEAQPVAAVESPLCTEFGRLKSNWWCFLLFGIFLAVCGTAALVFPALTVFTSFAAMVILGVLLIGAGAATILTALWAGRWSGLLLQVLVGILYVVAGFAIADTPVASAVAMTVFVAAFFIIVGAFRVVAAFVVRFPHWGWAVLNGVVTLLLGVVIYRHFPQSALWVVGVLVGVEMLLHGLNWIMLSLAVRNIPAAKA